MGTRCHVFPLQNVADVDRETDRGRSEMHELYELFTKIENIRAKTVPPVFHETATQAPACRWKIPMSRLSRSTFKFDVSVICIWQLKTSRYIVLTDYYCPSPPWSGVCAFETDHAWCWQWVPLIWALSRRKGGKNQTNDQHTPVLCNFRNSLVLFSQAHTLLKIGRIPLPVVSCPKLSGRSSLPSRWRGVGCQGRTILHVQKYARFSFVFFCTTVLNVNRRLTFEFVFSFSYNFNFFQLQ